MVESVLFSLEKTCVKPGTVLIETVLSGDTLYDQMQQWLLQIASSSMEYDEMQGWLDFLCKFLAHLV